MKLRYGRILFVTSLLASCSVSDPNTETSTSPIFGGSIAGPGEYEAVVTTGLTPFGGCTGTLINKDTVLTAAHCFCTQTACYDNISVTVTFRNVLPVGSSIRDDIAIQGVTDLHPSYDPLVSLYHHDFAVVHLNEPADQTVQVAPIRVSNQVPSTQQPYAHFLVGYGRHGDDCSLENSPLERRWAGVGIDEVTYSQTYSDWTLRYIDSEENACPGDSGGPAINADQIVGVCNSGSPGSDSTYLATADAYLWLVANACPKFDKAFPDANFCDDPMCVCKSSEGDCDSDSQCGAGSSCVTDIGEANRWAYTEDLCWRDNDTAIFNTDASYGGTARRYPVGTWDYYTLQSNGVHDNISSVRVYPGYWVQLWKDANCWAEVGDHEDIDAFAPNVSAAMDNSASCIRVFPGVTFYASQSFIGAKETLPPNDFQLPSSFGTVGDNNIESVRTAPGVLVKLCTDTMYLGSCAYFSGSVSSLGAFNNTVSSMQVLAGVTLYQEDEYLGTSQTLSEGSYNAADLATVGDNAISSLIVAPGMKATLCTEANGQGTCKTYTGYNSFVGFVGTGQYRIPMDNQTSYVNVRPSFASRAMPARVHAVSGDFNADSRTDIALVGGGTRSMPIAFAQGTGTFTLYNQWNPGDFQFWADASGAQIVTGDFNGDGRDDIALSGGSYYTTIPVAFSNGDGTFTVTNLSSASLPDLAKASGVKILAGDANSDGRDDLILVGGLGWTGIWTGISNGDGTFTSSFSSVSSFPGWASGPGVKAAAGDVNNDGYVDIVLTGGSGWTTVPMAFRQSNGTWNVTNASVAGIPTWSQSSSVKLLVRDLNNDGMDDVLLVGGTNWTTIPVGFSTGTGALSPVSNSTVANFPGWAQAPGAEAVSGDFDNDGRADVALVGGGGWWTIPMAFSNGDGTFAVTNYEDP